MSTNANPVKRYSEAGLLYTVNGGEATIVGCTQLNQAHLDIPSAIPDGTAQYPVTAIGEAAFSYMSALQTISLPATLRRIEHGAFEHSGLTEVQLYDGLTSLAPYAFFNCVKLSRVVLPASGLNGLPDQVFGGCTALYRRGVTNLNRIHKEDMSDCGLQDLNGPKEIVTIVSGSGAAVGSAVGTAAASPRPPVDDSAPQELLRHGLELENEGKHSEAAAFYMQAHDLRAEVAGNVDLQTRVEALGAIAEAEYHLGVLLKLKLAPEKNGDGTSRPTAAELLHSAADTGNIADAMYHLGDLYAGGYGMQSDAAAALKYLKRAVAIGHERACLDLAFVYLDGTLEHANTDTALLYLRKCVEFSGPYAAIAAEELALLEEAAEMYRQMQRGDNGAAYTLYLLLKERPYALSKATAMDCLLKAADLHHPQAVDEMHRICVDAGDLASAYKWKSLQESLRSR